METLNQKKEAINLAILENRVKALNAIEGARVGDYLKLPYGIYTRFTHIWDDQAQTGGGSNSFYLGNSGFCSYSGGLDSGIKLTDIKLTNETKKGLIWFFSENHSAAHNGVDFEVEFRVFEPTESADLKGLPQIKAHEKRIFLESLPTITRINGNGQKYTLPLPEIVIQGIKNKEFFDHIEAETGLKFVEGKTQPTTHEQINTLLIGHNFKTKFYNNGNNPNLLVLKFNAD
jgi:hypothetical protein